MGGGVHSLGVRSGHPAGRAQVSRSLERRTYVHVYSSVVRTYVLRTYVLVPCSCGGCGAANINTTNSSLPTSSRPRDILRLRFGLPCVTSLADWKCNCRGHGGPRHSDCVERASEGNRRDARSVSFATEPLHGLFCKRRWRRVYYRHNCTSTTGSAMPWPRRSTACRTSKPSENRWSR